MNKHINRIHKIDLLRGVAIIFVVCFHYMWHYSPEYLLRDDNWSLKLASYGWTGVDIFFIVSGFCIAMTIEKIPNLSEFYVRRFARIYPAYVFCGLITLIFFYLFDLPGREVSWFTGVMNLVFANVIPGLNFQYIDGIYWALIIELKFYIIFGLIYYTCKDLNKSIFIWILMSVILNIVLLIDNNLILSLSSISPHANLFLVGLVAFNYNRINIKYLILIAVLSLLNIILNERYAENQMYFTILILTTFFILKLNINLKINYISWVGLISYSWYLIHNAVGLIIIRELNKLELQQYSIISAIFLILCLSCISFYLIEMKFKKIILKNYLKS